MKEPSIAELIQMARETFGRELSESEAAAYRQRLPRMVRAVNALRDFERSLGSVEPSVVYRMPRPEPNADDPS